MCKHDFQLMTKRNIGAERQFDLLHIIIHLVCGGEYVYIIRNSTGVSVCTIEERQTSERDMRLFPRTRFIYDSRIY